MKASKIILGLLLVTPAAIASDWMLVASSADVIVTADRQSLKINGTQRVIWIKYDYKKPKELNNKKSYTESVSYEGFDCLDNTSTTYQSLYYDKKGDVVYSTDYTTYVSWSPIVPDTYGDTTINAICRLEKTGFTPTPPSTTN